MVLSARNVSHVRQDIRVIIEIAVAFCGTIDGMRIISRKSPNYWVFYGLCMVVSNDLLMLHGAIISPYGIILAVI